MTTSSDRRGSVVTTTAPGTGTGFSLLALAEPSLPVLSSRLRGYDPPILGSEAMARTSYGDPDIYIEERVEQYQRWYDSKAVVAKRRYLRMRILAVVGGALVPVLINIKLDIAIGGYPLTTLAVTIISLLVAVAVALEGVLHYREQWKNYRSTEQSLGHEIVRFRTGTGPYQGVRDREAFSLLIERVEGAIAMENAATLNVMTRVPNASQT